MLPDKENKENPILCGLVIQIKNKKLNGIENVSKCERSLT